jgi:hypothetical protein
MYRIAGLCLLAATVVFMFKAPELKEVKAGVRSTFYSKTSKK